MKFLFACGGTAGHINPALSMAGLIRERHPNAEILFVGAEGGMETHLVPREGFAIETIPIAGLRRSVSFGAIRHNVSAALKLSRSLGQAQRILERFKPQVVVGTGGYASFPMVYAASRRKIPTAIHESNASPGLSNRFLARRVSKVMVSLPDSQREYRVPTELTGMPVRGEFLTADRERARAALGLDKRPFLLAFFGSLGAREMNRRMVEVLRLAARDGGTQIWLAAGKNGMGWVPKAIADAGVDLRKHPQLRVTEYLYDMPQALHAADLAVCRAGASTLAELCVTGCPAVLFPSPNVTGHQQEKNAHTLERNGAAVVRMETQADGPELYRLCRELLDDGPKRAEMRRNLQTLAIPDAGERIYRLLIQLTTNS